MINLNLKKNFADYSLFRVWFSVMALLFGRPHAGAREQLRAVAGEAERNEGRGERRAPTDHPAGGEQQV